MTTYCTNLANRGSTEYTGYGFDSFCKIGNNYYAIKADGLYLLSGSDDNGTDIAATVDYGDLDFGTSQLKRISTAYITASSETPMVLTITESEDAYDYYARNSAENIKTERFDTGKGLRSNYFGVAISNSLGGTFIIDAVEIAASASTRRI